MSSRLKAIPCVLMRGGTSKGPYFLGQDLPADREAIGSVLLAVMGSPDLQQIDGIGGATTLTSKVAIVSPSHHPDAQVDYLFAQVSINQAFVDFGPSCGNILSGVGPFAIEQGLVSPEKGTTTVRIHNVNTGALIDAVVQTENGEVTYTGDTAIDGVPGTAAPILCRYKNIAGSKTGALLPTGNVIDHIDGIDTTLIDVSTPMMMLRAADLGISGQESKSEIDANQALFERVESLRLEAGKRMGLGDVSGSVLPKVSLLSPPENGGNITSRYLVPHNCHAAHAVTGGLCVASCSVLKDSVADGIARVSYSGTENIAIEHPSGQFNVELSTSGQGTDMQVDYGGVMRTARKLFRGEVYIPE